MIMCAFLSQRPDLRRTILPVVASLALLGLPSLTALSIPASEAATITIINTDGAGEGFNDPTPVAPVGGNPGTTLGAQRLYVFQYAADVWGNILSSNVQIRVRAAFNPLSCDASSAVLGSAGAISVESDFTNAPYSGTWYPEALANRLAQVDLTPGGDDIQAQFNSSVDNNNNCLSGTNWYYGLDGNEGSDVDLVEVVLHELGHGLGFATYASTNTGAFLSGVPDVYSRFILDTTQNMHWNEMTNTQRLSSQVNTGHLVWDGPAVTGAAPATLSGTPTLTIHSPSVLAGTIPIGPASFGGALTVGGLTADIVLAQDSAAPSTDACDPLTNGAQLSGKIALIDRGTCTFSSKALAAQNAGAVAVIIANNVTASGPIALGGSDPSVTIPVVSITLEDGNAIKAQLGGGVNATLALDTAHLAGTDPNGYLKLYAPNPVEPGSSVSHWDVSATPNLLMEPAINRDLTQDVDLTLQLFQDIGWFTSLTPAPQGTPVLSSRLLPNVPNPFNPSTSIQFDLERTGPVRLDIYDLSGRLVRHLLASPLDAGRHSLRWDGTDDAGRSVASGVYLSHLKTADTEATRRMVLLK